ncbi:MAG: serine/threonine-protein kinase, partial [Pyrinomonadaceae bacterium]
TKMIEAGTTLQNRYLISKPIGSGGMGTVYLATDARLGSSVAVKETLFDDAELQHAFEREAQLLNSLRHPALPHVIDYFTEDDRQFLVMEYFAGEDLSEILKRKGAFPVAEVLRWADDLLDAVIYLHSRKIPVVHRDIKPQNLKLTPNGEIILLDFGLAKGKPGEASQISRTNSVFGYSRSYAPLEQIQGTGTDVRSDIYSLGATVYHLLTGKPPVDALTRATAFVNNQPDPLIPANVLSPQIPASIARILEQSLNLNPDLRPQTASQLRELISKEASQLRSPDPDTTRISTARNSALTANLAHLDEFENRHSIEVPIGQINELAKERSDASHSFTGFSVAENRPSHSAGKFASIAAAILILGGGSVAAWYVTGQSKSGNSQSVNSNSVANVASVVKPLSNSGTKNEEKVAEKIEEKSLNPKSSANIIEPKQSESLNKTVPLKTPNIEPAVEESPALDEQEPIIVKSAPPTQDSKKSQDQDVSDPRRESDKSLTDDPDDAPNADAPQKRKKDGVQPDEDRIERRERRATPDRRKKQKLPTLLGAPQ